MEKLYNLKFKVTNKAKKPNSFTNTCFYCHQKIGDYHKDDCVLVSKKIEIQAIIKYEITVPNDWDKEQIEFARNDGNWCSNNMIQELEKLTENGEQCLCQQTKFKYLKDTSTPFLTE